MSDILRFEYSLSEKEIEENFKDFDFFSNLMDGLQEALHNKSGEISTKNILPLLEDNCK